MRLARFILLILLVILLVGCSEKPTSISPESITDIREYDLDGVRIVVGVGKWMPNGAFQIKSFDGETYDIDPEVEVYEGPVTLESFKRLSK